MIGATLSGVTFISVPGETGNSAFHYFQFVLGNMAGYVVIALFLLPFYYRKNILSIYSVLQNRMGKEGYRAASGFFILSKVIGASFRLFLAALVIDMAITGPLGVPFWVAVLFCLILIWLYTHRSGIRTVVWTDTLQTVVLLSAALATAGVLLHSFGKPAGSVLRELMGQPATTIFEFGWKSPHNFYKQFVSGIVLTIALNGFDQDIIQKNLTCADSGKARKNMLWFSLWFGISVFLFLILGALLYAFAREKGIVLPERSDQVYPFLALNYLGKGIALLFILGISAAAFSSADSAITAMTTSFCVDFLNIGRKPEKRQVWIRNRVHLAVSLVLFLVILLFHELNNESVVTAIFKAAGYTYGPIAGVFCFSLFLNRIPFKKALVPVCIVSPVLTFFLVQLVEDVRAGYRFGFEMIVVNTLITFLLLLLLFSERGKDPR